MTEHEYKRLSAPVDLAAERARLTPERRNAADAMTLYARIRHQLIEAVAERDQNAYRRTLRAFRRAARRLERRYNALTPQPTLPLGNIHAAPAMPRPKQQPTPHAGDVEAAAA
jgi:hypothetical protein